MTKQNSNLPDSDYHIEKIVAREILDSRGNPTVQVDVKSKTGFGRFSIPSGASKGRFEAVELRDMDRQRYHGRGVLKAVDNVNKILAPRIIGLDSRNQEEIDRVLIDVDGSPDKSRLGANALLGISVAAAKCAADVEKMPFYQHISSKQGSRMLLPLPLMNILNGGKHAGNDLAFQEFMVLPVGFKSFHGALRCGVEVYQSLKERLESKYGKSSINVGDEGGFAPPIENVEQALGEVSDSVEEAGYDLGRNVVLGIDPAPDSFYDPVKNSYRVNGKDMTSDQLLDYYQELVENYSLKSIEDPFHDEAFIDFANITKNNPKLQIVGDDLFVTNVKRLEKGIQEKAGNALLIKPNQAGTLTETFAATDKARSSSFGLVMSHRSGETEDNTIADLAVGLGTGQIKAGAPARGERTVKYNRLVEIEQELGTNAQYYGPEFQKKHA